MKKILLATAIALAFTASAANAGQSTISMKVTGMLTVSACTPTLTGASSGTVDYGTINVSSLNKTSANQLGMQNANQIQLSISCPSAMKAGWTISDDHADTRADVAIQNADAAGGTVTNDANYSYGVGLTAGNVKIGAFTVYADVANLTADGTKVDAISTLASNIGNNPTWTKSTTGSIKNANTEVMSLATSGTTTPVAFQNATIPLKTSLAIQGTNTLAIGDDTDLNGQATITIKYL